MPSVSASHVIDNVSEPELVRLGEQLAFVARRGDLFALSGELGAGKTTLARAIIQALTGNKGEEIPSPTFTLVQSYVTPRMPVAHLDLYRLRTPSELEELGLDIALKNGIAIVEWPEQAGDLLPPDRLDVRLDDNGGGASRRVTLTAHGDWATRLDRFIAMRALIAAAGDGRAAIPAGRCFRAPLRPAGARRASRRHPHGLATPARRPRHSQRPAL